MAAIDELINSGKTEKVSVYNDIKNFKDVSRKLYILETAVKNFNLSDFSDNNSITLDSKKIIKNPDYSIRKKYEKCSVCGKPLEYPSESGYCSKECMIKGAILNFSTDIEKFRDKFYNIDNHLNSISNAINVLFSNNSDALSLENGIRNNRNNLNNDEYVFIQVSLQKIMIMLKRKINSVLIRKNEILLNIIKSNQDGVSAGGLDNTYLSNVSKLYKISDKLSGELNSRYEKIYNGIIKKFKLYALNGESIYFFKTSRSEYKKPGDKLLQLKTNNSSNSILENINMDPLRESIENKFPDIQEKDYLEDPSVFENKIKNSPLNENKISEAYKILQNSFKSNTEPLPEYTNLNIQNKEWIHFLLTSWGVTGKAAYGFPKYP